MKRHALLVNPAFMLNDGTVISNLNQKDFPLSLGLLGTILVRNGYSAEVVNANVQPDWEERVLREIGREDLAFVGFSCMSSQVCSAMRLSRRIKEARPALAVVFGGVHPTLMPESLLRTPWVDYCVAGEGDAAVLPLMELLNGARDPSDVPNLCWKGEDGRVHRGETAPPTPFESLPERVDESLYGEDFEKYVLEIRADGRSLRGFSILTGLGCHYRCAFCINSVTRRSYRSMSAARIHGLMRELAAKRGIEFFNFQDEHFFGDRPRLFELLERLEGDPELRGKVRWNTTIRVSDVREDFVNVELLRRIKATGGDGLGVGGESGSDRMLKILKKGITRKDILRAVRFCNEAGVTLNFSFVMLWPGETVQDMIETARLIAEIYAAGPFANVPYFQTYRPYPGSLWESDLSRFEDPENLPDDTWRFQSIDNIRTLPRDDAETVYRIVNTTQFLCAAGFGLDARGPGLRERMKDLLYRLCEWRLRTMNFRFYAEGLFFPALRRKFLQY